MDWFWKFPHLDDEKRTKYYETLDRETSRLRGFVDQLLDFGRVESGQARYRLAPIDPVALITDAVNRFTSAPAADRHPIECHWLNVAQYEIRQLFFASATIVRIVFTPL